MRTIIYSHLKLTFSSLCCLFTLSYNLNSASDVEFLGVAQLGDTHKFSPVSYTHLTLPTKA